MAAAAPGAAAAVPGIRKPDFPAPPVQPREVRLCRFVLKLRPAACDVPLSVPCPACPDHLLRKGKRYYLHNPLCYEACPITILNATLTTLSLSSEDQTTKVFNAESKAFGGEISILLSNVRTLMWKTTPPSGSWPRRCAQVEFCRPRFGIRSVAAHHQVGYDLDVMLLQYQQVRADQAVDVLPLSLPHARGSTGSYFLPSCADCYLGSRYCDLLSQTRK